MSRIEKNQPVMEEVKEMKGELMSAVKRGRKRGWKTWAALVVLVLFVSLVLFAAWTVAATGLLKIPVISDFAYAAPAPTRVVGEGIPFETVMQQQTSTSSLSVSESTLTTELRNSLETSGQTFIDPDDAQVAVLGNSGIELFLPLRDTAQGTALVVRVRLSVENGVLGATAEDVTVGSWKMGAWLREGLVNPALEGLLDSVSRELEGSIAVTSVRTEEGIVIIAIDTP